jgi:hypothetical protein
MGGDPYNLVPNASFEIDTAGWGGDDVVSVERYTAQAYTGEASLLVTFAGVSADAGPWIGVPATAGRTYRLTLWARDVDTLAQQKAGITFFDGYAEEGAEPTGPTAWSEPTTITTSGWTEMTVTAVAPPGTTRMYPGAYTVTLAAAGTQVCYDLVSVVDVTDEAAP